MNHSHLVRLFATSIAFISCNSFSSSLFAEAAESEFSLCAAEALGDQISSDTKFRIDLSDMETIHVSAATSPARAVHTTLIMTIETGTGENLGDVVCTLNHMGDVVSAMFEHEFSGVASK